jgi:diguanylate cyclase (GGDEF)-like protein/PAS domain S-box-containing protein
LTLRLIRDDVPDPPANTGEDRVALEPRAFEELFEYAGGMLAILDSEGRFVAINSACRRVLGHDPSDLIGRSLLDYVKPHSPSGSLGAPSELAASAETDQGRVVELLGRHRHADGSWRWLLWSGAVHGERWYTAARDVTDWIRLEDRVGRDPLTQLPNREVFTEEVTSALARHERSGRCLAVLFIDIDSLKQINDSIGHEAGDRLVAQVAERLRLAVRTGDIVGRLGGDEFGILVESLGDESEAVTVAERALASLDRPVELGSGPIAVSASIGLSTAYGAPSTAGTLIHEADIAMYQAKAAGRNRFAIYDAELRAKVEHRLGLDRDLGSALEHDQLTLAYEPIVSLRDGTVLGFEATLRWEHPERGVVPAAEFMPLAERSGLTIPLGLWALRNAAEQLAGWRNDGADVFVALRVSPRQLADDAFISGVREVVEATGLPRRALGVEVAEAAALADPSSAISRLSELRDLGVRVAFDDFGSGYSSLHYLIQLPVDAIKLDRSYAVGLSSEDARASRAVVTAVVAAAHELGIRIVAEGVENQVQLEALLAAGCDIAQGPVFGPPAAAGEVSFEPLAGALAAGGEVSTKRPVPRRRASGR